MTNNLNITASGSHISDIKTVAITGGSSTILQYRGSDEKLLGRVADLGEYNLENLLQKDNYNDTFNLEYLENASEEFKDPWEIDKISKTFFPTNTVDEIRMVTLDSTALYEDEKYILGASLPDFKIGDYIKIIVKKDNDFLNTWDYTFETDAIQAHVSKEILSENPRMGMSSVTIGKEKVSDKEVYTILIDEIICERLRKIKRENSNFFRLYEFHGCSLEGVYCCGNYGGFERLEAQFFSLTNIGDQRLVMIDVPENYNKVYLVNEIIGKEDLVEDIPGQFEYEIEILNNIHARKVLWFIISPEGEVVSINISYQNWLSSNNPERNKNTYLLREDDFHKIGKGSGEYLKRDGQYTFDGNSGTLLGNKRFTRTYEDYPGLRELIRNYAGLQTFVPKSEKERFLLGQIVEINGKYKAVVYESGKVSTQTSYIRYVGSSDWTTTTTGNIIFEWINASLNVHPETDLGVAREGIVLNNKTGVIRKGDEVLIGDKSYIATREDSYLHRPGEKPEVELSRTINYSHNYGITYTDYLYYWVELYDTWLVSRVYSSGELVRYKGKYYISVDNNNVNSFPDISPKWSGLDNMRAWKTDTINIVVSEGGEILTPKKLTVNSDTTQTSIGFRAAPGYILKRVYTESREFKEDPIRILKLEPYTKSNEALLNTIAFDVKKSSVVSSVANVKASVSMEKSVATLANKSRFTVDKSYLDSAQYKIINKASTKETNVLPNSTILNASSANFSKLYSKFNGIVIATASNVASSIKVAKRAVLWDKAEVLKQDDKILIVNRVTDKTQYTAATLNNYDYRVSGTKYEEGTITLKEFIETRSTNQSTDNLVVKSREYDLWDTIREDRTVYVEFGPYEMAPTFQVYIDGGKRQETVNFSTSYSEASDRIVAGRSYAITISSLEGRSILTYRINLVNVTREYVSNINVRDEEDTLLGFEQTSNGNVIITDKLYLNAAPVYKLYFEKTYTVEMTFRCIFNEGFDVKTPYFTVPKYSEIAVPVDVADPDTYRANLSKAEFKIYTQDLNITPKISFRPAGTSTWFGPYEGNEEVQVFGTLRDMTVFGPVEETSLYGASGNPGVYIVRIFNVGKGSFTSNLSEIEFKIHNDN